MCVIAVSRSGSRQPSEKEFKKMWLHNPDGAGYMYARAGKVVIHKGFMTFDEFMFAVRSENFTMEDAVIYHFRISTQAGKTRTMTHPFPLSSVPDELEALDVVAPVGIAHNGIIRMTTDYNEKRFSDTALFIKDYLAGRLVKTPDDLNDPRIQDIITTLGGWSKFAILTGSGDIITLGEFTDDAGILLSNENHKNSIQHTTRFFKNYRTACNNSKEVATYVY